MPVVPRPDLEILSEWDNPLALLLWQVLRDVLLWAQVGREDRPGLFASPTERLRERLGPLPEASELHAPLGALLSVSAMPEAAAEARVAEACAAVALWAEARGMKATAVHFAEAAARLEPERSARSFTAGRLSRRLGDAQRAAIWYGRAARLARVACRRGDKASEVDFANAHLGYGNLEYDLGRLGAAERHYLKAARAAMRAGQKSLSAMAHHALMTACGDGERYDEAFEHAQEAATLYRTNHPRFPNFAQDVAHLFSRKAYFSSALLILEKVLPWLGRQRERVMALATIARAAAAVKDHIRYERAAAGVLTMVEADKEFAAPALYHVAEGARSFWKWDRAQNLASRALQIARERDDATVIQYAERLLRFLPDHEPGDVDLVPDEDSTIDTLTHIILRKLRKRAAPDPQSGTIPPEQYPTD